MKKKFENRPIFDEVKAYKTKCASFLGHPIEKATREMSREYRQAFFLQNPVRRETRMSRGR